MELERRWREEWGEQWPQVKQLGSFLDYTHSSDCITDYPKIALAHYVHIPEVNGNY